MFFLSFLLVSSLAFSNWMDTLIAQELKPYYERGITQQDLDDTWHHKEHPVAHFLMARFCIKDNVLSVEHPHFESEFIHGRCESIKIFLKNMCLKRKMPDVDFILCLGDAMDLGINFVPRPDTPPMVYKAPIFVLSKKKTTPNTIIFPSFEIVGAMDAYRRILKLNQTHPWAHKKEQLFWRGSTTGCLRDEKNQLVGISTENWQRIPRVVLALIGKQHPELINAHFIQVVQHHESDFPSFFCSLFPLKPYADLEEHLCYKYLIDVDGNTTTYRGYQFLFSNSLLFKQASDEFLWYYDAWQPFVHFIPVKVDFSDLLEKILWAINNDKKAEEIANRATRLALDVFCVENIEEFTHRLLCQYQSCLRDSL
jgi:hypothetical protein